MSTRQDGAASLPIETYDELVGWIAAGSKPKDRWRIGTEHEKFVFNRASLAPVAYDGDAGIRALMDELIKRFGWQPILEGETVIALKRPSGEAAATISLEPGGQFELSGAPVETLHDTADETDTHLKQVLAIGADLGINFMGLGFAPTWTRDQIPRMPKQRYAVMTRYMPQVGRRGLDMMYRTCTIQVNLDFGSEADMVQKLRVSLALQPIATALFASSPFTERAPNGFNSMRSEVWRDTDPNRTGMLPFAFEPRMGFQRYVDYALGVPMYFIYRDGRYIDVAGASFRQFMDGKLPQLPGERPTIDDWSDHMTTLFPEVRLKRFLEMRGADGGPLSRICALPAFWVGLLYDQSALDAASKLIEPWSAGDRHALRNAVPREGFRASVGGRTVLDVARDALAISRAGLKARNRLDRQGRDETIYLDALDAMVKSGHSMADDLLAKYNGAWGGSIDRVFQEYTI